MGHMESVWVQLLLGLAACIFFYNTFLWVRVISAPSFSYKFYELHPIWVHKKVHIEFRHNINWTPWRLTFQITTLFHPVLPNCHLFVVDVFGIGNLYYCLFQADLWFQDGMIELLHASASQFVAKDSSESRYNQQVICEFSTNLKHPLAWPVQSGALERIGNARVLFSGRPPTQNLSGTTRRVSTATVTQATLQINLVLPPPKLNFNFCRTLFLFLGWSLFGVMILLFNDFVSRALSGNPAGIIYLAMLLVVVIYQIVGVMILANILCM